VSKQKKELKRDAIVEIISGDAKGQRGRVLRVMRKDGKVDRVTVEKIRLVKRHRKQVQGQATGGIVEMEAPIAASNVKVVNAAPSKRDA
jgi:large subunit ribosomal protein L24